MSIFNFGRTRINVAPAIAALLLFGQHASGGENAVSSPRNTRVDSATNSVAVFDGKFKVHADARWRLLSVDDKVTVVYVLRADANFICALSVGQFPEAVPTSAYRLAAAVSRVAHHMYAADKPAWFSISPMSSTNTPDGIGKFWWSGHERDPDGYSTHIYSAALLSGVAFFIQKDCMRSSPLTVDDENAKAVEIEF